MGMKSMDVFFNFVCSTGIEIFKFKNKLSKISFFDLSC